jgi:hypothetical protein
MAQSGIGKNQGRHGLNYRHSPGNDTRIMPSLSGQFDKPSFIIRGCLFRGNSRGRLERHPEENRLAIADPALDAAAVVSDGSQAFSLFDEQIIMPGTAHLHRAKPAADFKPSCRRYGQHGMRQQGRQFVKNRLTPPAGTPRQRQVMAPPMESPSARAVSISSSIAFAVLKSGQRTRDLSTKARVSPDLIISGAITWPTELTQATIRTPCLTESNFSAITPAATLAAVSRALARPPPLADKMPYLRT